jgi:hypothetical protein
LGAPAALGFDGVVGFDYLHDVPRQLKLTKHFMLGAAKVWQRTS